MSEHNEKILKQFVSASGMKEIDEWVNKYPSDEKQSAVMSTLRVVQEQYGHLTEELMNAVAEYLDMPAIAVYEVATFYSMYELKPCAKHLINVCTNVSCMLNGSAKVVKHIEQKLDIKLGQTTGDGKFGLRSVECLGACVNAPMMQIDKDYHENLTPERIDNALTQYDD